MRPTDYLGPTVPPLNVAIVERAHDDIGEGEDIGPNGQGTNRSEYVDAVNTLWGSPLGSYWCGNAVGKWFKDGGANTPSVPGDVDNWVRWAKKTRRWRLTPFPGYAIIYGVAGNAEHIALVSRLVPDPTASHGQRVVEIGGNTSLGKYNRDGWTVAQKIEESARVLGYVAPDPNDGRS